MDTPTLAIAIKKAEQVARSIVPERGPVGPRGPAGRDGVVDENAVKLYLDTALESKWSDEKREITDIFNDAMI